MAQNQGFFLVKPLQGMVTTDNFAIKDIDYPTITDGQFIIKADYLSVDPYLRGSLANEASVGKVVPNYTVGEVIESKHPDYAVGDHVTGITPLQKFIASDGTGLRKVPKQFNIPLSSYIGVMGMPGQTAFGGVTHGLQIKKGDTVVVSGAAGAVGSAVGQFARVLGAKRVIGIAGGEAKCAHVVEKFGFDACIDYKQYTTIETMREKLRELCPEGIDYYYDNTGGVVTSAVFDLINYSARIAICGSISEYNNEKPEMVPSFLFKIIYKHATIQGIIVFHYFAIPGFYDSFYNTFGSLIEKGQLKYDETINEGFDKLPEAFVGLFKGTNLGKMIVKA